MGDFEVVYLPSEKMADKECEFSKDIFIVKKILVQYIKKLDLFDNSRN